MSAADETGASGDRARPGILTAILDWLRQGYPQGVPPQDRFPLIALLARRLTDEQVEWVAEQATAYDAAPISRVDAQVLITKVTNELPSGDDIERVRRHLVAAGVDIDWNAPRNGD